jgi:hypothetical protein
MAKYKVEIVIPKIVVELIADNLDAAALKAEMDKVRQGCIEHIKKNIDDYLPPGCKKNDLIIR